MVGFTNFCLRKMESNGRDAIFRKPYAVAGFDFKVDLNLDWQKQRYCDKIGACLHFLILRT